MNQFVPAEMKIISMNLRDILTESEETTEPTKSTKTTGATGATDSSGGIITPPDEFDHD